jgi:D-alanyl-D-alanine dipeptidase
MSRRCAAALLVSIIACSPVAAPSEVAPSREAKIAAQERGTPGIFRITPVRPVPELLREARAATPPEERNLAAPDLVEVVTLDRSIKLDIRYATTNNFLGTKIYEEGRAFLQRPAAEALVGAHQELGRLGYGILVHDAYRPWFVTKLFWDATPPDKHRFVANPAHGSRHNRGCAVDVTLYELATGNAVQMPSLYDEMSDRAKPTYGGGTPEQRRLRDLLRTAMEAQGFLVNEDEWWHFDYKDWKLFPIGNEPFDKLGAAKP